MCRSITKCHSWPNRPTFHANTINTVLATKNWQWLTQKKTVSSTKHHIRTHLLEVHEKKLIFYKCRRAIVQWQKPYDSRHASVHFKHYFDFGWSALVWLCFAVQKFYILQSETVICIGWVRNDDICTFPLASKDSNLGIGSLKAKIIFLFLCTGSLAIMQN